MDLDLSPAAACARAVEEAADVLEEWDGADMRVSRNLRDRWAEVRQQVEQDDRTIMALALEITGLQVLLQERDRIIHSLRLQCDAHQRDQEVRQWQPIATAPKDGRDVIVVFGMRPDVAIARYADGWIDSSGGLSTGIWLSAPTHWMPLPSLPEPT